MSGHTRRSSSLRLRVTALATAMVTLALVVAGVLLANWLRGSLLDDADAQLSDQVRFVGALSQQGALPPILNATGADTGQVQVVTADRVVIAVSPGLAATRRLDVFDPPPIGREESRTVAADVVGGRDGSRYRVVARTVDSPVGALTVYAASSLQAGDQAVHELVVSLWVGMPALVLLSAAVIWFVVGRSLRPVERMRQEVATIQGGRMDVRLSSHQAAAELDALAATMNGMLDRIDQGMATRRRFLADASHELRSPLTSARTQLEVGLAYPDRTDWTATAREVLIEVERLEVLAGELLDLARIESDERPLVLSRVDLASLVATEAARYSDGRLRVTHDAAAFVEADRSLMVRLLRNVLDNALRHARDRVDVRIERGADTVRLVVGNDGDPISDDDRERIFEPFTRLDDSRSRDEGGAGLGLSIARRIAAAHGGTLVAVPRVDGAEFVLQLPLSVEG